MPQERIIFPHMQRASQASQRGWRGRWERGEAIGPKGREYLKQLEEPYDIEGPVFEDWEFEIDY